jgi:hypothetical protein
VMRFMIARLDSFQCDELDWVSQSIECAESLLANDGREFRSNQMTKSHRARRCYDSKGSVMELMHIMWTQSICMHQQ